MFFQIWFLVIEQINDAKSLEATANASTFWHTLLEPQRQTFLFPQVWKIFQAVIPPTESSKRTRFFRRGLPNHAAKCRLVCKSWCSAIDYYYQTLPIYYKLTEEMRRKHDFEWKVTPFSGLPLMALNKHFLSTHNSNCSRSPLISRAVEIFVRDEDRDYQIMVGRLAVHDPERVVDEQVKLKDMLIKYGKHIWHCHLYWNFVKDIQIQKDMISTSLKLMPNLKTLRVMYFCDELNLTGLPNMDKIEFLSFETRPQSIVQAVLPVCKNVTSLEIRGVQFSQNFHFADVTLKKLNQLSWRCESETDFENFEKSSQNWPLTKLKLEFGPNACMQWSKIISVLQEKLGGTLLCLELSLPEREALSLKDHHLFGEVYSAPSMNLPNLKDLKLSFKNIHYFNFIFPMQKHLKRLDVEMVLTRRKYHEIQVSGELIQYVKDMNQMLGPDIWLTFPKLETINIKLDAGHTLSPCKVMNWNKSRPKR